MTHFNEKKVQCGFFIIIMLYKGKHGTMELFNNNTE